jgi:hypothetical protein
MDMLVVCVVYTGWLRQIGWLCLLFCPYCLPTLDKILDILVLYDGRLAELANLAGYALYGDLV